MQFVVHFLHILAVLPIWALYGFSSFLAWFLRVVIGYRKEVVIANLRNAFPEKDEQSIRSIVQEFYIHLADTMVETIKLGRMSEAMLKNRVEFKEPELLQRLADQGKNVILLMGHSGNWEWAGAVTAASYDLNMLPVYRQVKDPAMNQYFIELRSRFGSVPVLDKDAFQDIRKQPTPHAVALLADQTPGPKKGLWIDFLHQETPFFRGTEVLLKRLDYEVVFAQVRKLDRGYYSIHFEHYQKGEGEKEFDVTRKFVDFLEREIQAQPFNWLWSHRRWKHQMPESAVRVER